MVRWLQAVGPASPGPMGGFEPISAQELRAWQHGTGIELAGWEFAAMLNASRAYVNQYHSDDPAPPCGDPDDMADPEVVEEKLAKIFEGLAKPVNKPKKRRR